MIFITLGNQNFQFRRLLDKVEELVLKGVITDKVFAQIGYTQFNSNVIETIDFLNNDKFCDYIENSDFVISHGGTGSIFSCLIREKKVIVAARLKKYKEHIDNHQLEIVEIFRNKKFIIGLNEELSDLEDKILSINDIDLKKFISNNDKFNKELIKIIEK